MILRSCRPSLAHLALLLALASLACVVSPTGRRQLMLYSSAQMDELGAQSFEQIKAEGTISSDPAATEAFKDNQWNKYRIECKGDSLKTWVNDVPCADLRDSLTARGVIGLQVHGVGRDFHPYEVRWRNIRIQELP